jgi:hypothetical protein
MSAPNILIGGGFSDILGNPLAFGYLTFELSDSAVVNTTTQIVAGKTTRINLDADGNVAGSGPTVQVMWSNDDMTPDTTYYTVSAYSAQGQLVWGPNYVQVLSDPSPFDIGAWIPSP